MAALARQGYQVAGLEPSARLHGLAQRQLEPPALLALERAAYEDLLQGIPSLDRHAPYDGVILGWTSFSHLGTTGLRQALLARCRQLCPEGPLLLSWMDPAAGTAGPRTRQLRRGLRLLGSRRQSEDDFFSMHAGFIHKYTRREIQDLASSAGYEVRELSDVVTYPHALLQPRSTP